MDYSLKDLECIIRLAEDQNFTKAAEHLYMSQPALSRKLQEIEDKLGVQIFKRSTHQVTVTEKGQYIIRQGMAILSQCEELNRCLTLFKQREQIPLQIGYSSISELDWIAKLSNAIYIRNDTFCIIPQQWECLEKLWQRKIDAAIVAENEARGISWLNSIPLSREGLSAFLAENDPLASCDTISIHHLKGRRLVIPNRRQNRGETVNCAEMFIEVKSILNSFGIESGQIEGLIGLQSFIMAISSQGKIAVLHDNAAMQKTNLIHRCHIREIREGFGKVLVYPNWNERHPMIQILVEVANEMRC